MNSIISLLLTLALFTHTYAKDVKVSDLTLTQIHLDSFFQTVEGPGTFIVLHDASNKLLIHNPGRARKLFIPASTFKIPNSLIALETGTVKDETFTLSRDTTLAPTKPFWPHSWKRGQTMRTAFQNSVYWYYQEIARRIGSERMTKYMAQFEYGNQNISPSIDTFWLEGDIRISPVGQVDFLRRFYHGKLGVSDRTTNVVKSIMVLEEGSDFTLRGKTGTAEVTQTSELGWLVGYLERGEEIYFYALNMEGERVWEEWPPRKRKALVLDLFRYLELLQ